MSYTGMVGGGYIACSVGDGSSSYRRFRNRSGKEKTISPPPAQTILSTDSASAKLVYSKQQSDPGTSATTGCFGLSTPPPVARRGGSPQFGDEYSLFRSRSTSLSSSTGSLRSTGTVCESEVSERARSLRSTEPPSRVLSPLENTRNKTYFYYHKVL